MKPLHWAMFGLSLDILGAFLLAVEAIKLKNLRTLRETILSPLHRAILPPLIRFSDDESVAAHATPENPPNNSTSSRQVVRLKAPRFADSRLFMATYLLLHLVAGLAVILAVNSLSKGIIYAGVRVIFSWLAGRALWISIPLLILISCVSVPGLWMLGELVHIATIRVSGGLVDALFFIERETANGIVGILGFAIMLLGYLIQMYANHLEILTRP